MKKLVQQRFNQSFLYFLYTFLTLVSASVSLITFDAQPSVRLAQNQTKIMSLPEMKPYFYVYTPGYSYKDPKDPKAEKCPIAWDYTSNRDNADVVIYNVLDSNVRVLSRGPKEGQIYVVESMESDTNYGFSHVQHMYDYTMDYRLTSDVPIPYAECFVKNFPPLPLEEKTGFVAAFVSNCGASNGRTNFIRKMMEHIHIDSFGHCLHNKKEPPEWSKGNRDRTKENIISHYKFTLAFENSDDDYYITEKLYQPLMMGSVPIFRGCKQVLDFAPHILLLMQINSVQLKSYVIILRIFFFFYFLIIFSF